MSLRPRTAALSYRSADCGWMPDRYRFIAADLRQPVSASMLKPRYAWAVWGSGSLESLRPKIPQLDTRSRSLSRIVNGSTVQGTRPSTRYRSIWSISYALFSTRRDSTQRRKKRPATI